MRMRATGMRMRWAVYWMPDDDIYINWFKDPESAQAFISELIADCNAEVDEGHVPDWEITLLEIKAEVHDSPDGLSLRDIDDNWG